MRIPLYLLKLTSDPNQIMQIILNWGGTNFKIVFKSAKKPSAPKLDL